MNRFGLGMASSAPLNRQPRGSANPLMPAGGNRGAAAFYSDRTPRGTGDHQPREVKSANTRINRCVDPVPNPQERQASGQPERGPFQQNRQHWSKDATENQVGASFAQTHYRRNPQNNTVMNGYKYFKKSYSSLVILVETSLAFTVVNTSCRLSLDLKLYGECLFL